MSIDHDLDHMTPEELVEYGTAALRLAARYLEGIDQQPILPSAEPGDLRALLPNEPPERPEPMDRILADIEELIVPALVGWQAPGWFAFFPANSSPPSIIGELLSAAFAQQGMLWSTSPATTELECHVLDWLVDLLGLPESWKSSGPGGGVIQMSASDATHTALVVARVTNGAPIADQVVYSSSQAHSSIEKGARLAGFDHIRLLDVDDVYALRPDALADAVEADIAAGLVPSFVCSTVGTTGTTAVDPVAEISRVAHRHGLWHHVDAAYAGSAMILPELRHHQSGLNQADSYVFNPHKWMFTNFDCSVFYVADRAPLIQTMSIVPPYLRNAASDTGEVTDYRDWHVPLGRRFRALKLWMVLRTYGAEGIRHHLRRHVRMAADLHTWIEDHPHLEPIAPAPFGLVTFRHIDGDAATERIVSAINSSGHSYVTPSNIDGRRFIRVSIGQTTTGASHVERLRSVIDWAARPSSQSGAAR